MSDDAEVSDSRLGRRAVIAAAAGLAVSAAAAPARAGDAVSSGPLSPLPIDLPKTEFVYEAIVELEPRVSLGLSPLGERFMIGIKGGVFAGPKIKGTVLPGGADRQLLRKDGALLLNALYEIKTDDGVIITINNRVLITKRADGSRYAFSTLDVIAPEGPHAWLNQLVLVGTLNSIPGEPRVLIRVFSLV